jgi:transposase
MIEIGYYMTIITLHKQGKSQREIAKLVGHDRKTVGRIIKQYKKDGTTEFIRNNKAPILEGHKDLVIELMEKEVSGVRIHEELKKEGLEISYPSVARYVESIKGKNNVCVRFHTEVGEEAQVDFGYVGLLPKSNGKKGKAWVFNMRLSYSRLDYYEIVNDQKVETFLMCHINAFRFFEGVPKLVKIDNLKAAILNANFYEPVYQRAYKAMSEHYGYEIIPCRVRKPQEKGKVEAGIKYVKSNFFKGRNFNNRGDVESQLRDWIKYKCNSRIHGTTKKVPQEVFINEEKKMLKELPLEPYTIGILAKRKVCKDCHITVDSSYYSVPYKYVAKFVEVHIKEKLVSILHDGKEIAVHIKSTEKGSFVTNQSHYNQYKLFTPESAEYRSKYQERMKKIGSYAVELFAVILIKKPNSWYRAIKGILNLKNLYDDRTIDLSCKRALAFEITEYSTVKNICKTGSYNLPIDNEGAYAKADN